MKLLEKQERVLRALDLEEGMILKFRVPIIKGVLMADEIIIKEVEIKKENDRYWLVSTKDRKYYLGLDYLLTNTYEIIPKKLKIGEVKCTDLKCACCPLNFFNCGGYDKEDKTIVEIYNDLVDEWGDETIEKVFNDGIFEYRLNEEVEDEELWKI